MGVAAGALDGLTVIELSQVMAGPYCGRMLADLGARVIKVEPPGGEMGRGQKPYRNAVSTVFTQLNAGKEARVLDLKRPGDVAKLKELAGTADILVENYRPGVLDRLGVGCSALSAINPRLIFCSISGFRPDGPLADHPSFAPVVHALSGYDLAQMSYQGNAGRPANTGIMIADLVAGTNAVVAILAALAARQRTGRGQHVGTTLFSTMASLLVRELQEAQLPPKAGGHFYPPILARDGYLFVMPLSDKQIGALAKVIDAPDLVDDPRFATAVSRLTHWTELMARTEAWSSLRDGRECERLLLAKGVPAACFRTLRDVLAEPALSAELGLVEVDEQGERFMVAPVPFWMADTPPRPSGSAPKLEPDGGEGG